MPPTKWERHEAAAHYPDPTLESIPRENVGTLPPWYPRGDVDNSAKHSARSEKVVHHGKFDYGQIRDTQAHEDLLPDINRHNTSDLGRFASFFGTEDEGRNLYYRK